MTSGPVLILGIESSCDETVAARAHCECVTALTLAGKAGYVTDRPYTPEDYAATVYEYLGIDREKPLYTPDGRPIFLAHKGDPMKELL